MALSRRPFIVAEGPGPGAPRRAARRRPAVRSPMLVIACAGMMLFLVLGIRQTFGLFLPPVVESQGWGREAFGLAIALQNVFWGLTQPFFGALADRYGSGRVIAVGGLFYMAGLLGMAHAETVWMFNVSAGLLVGLGLSGTSFAVVLGAVGRSVPHEKRGFAVSVAAAAGAAGQFVMIPVAQGLIGSQGWVVALIGLSLVAALMIPLGAALTGRASDSTMERQSNQTMREALREAMRHEGFVLLNVGFFVCGFQITFMVTHLPAYLADRGLTAWHGALALSLIGLFNIAGTTLWGWLGNRYRKRSILSGLYLARTVAISIFILAPMTTVTMVVFAAVIGFLWLATVALTNAIVAQIFGIRYMAMLFGIVFMSHQVGSFLGPWLGGLLFDLLGSYDLVWWFCAWLGVTAALLHWPIDERRMLRLTPSRG